MNAAVRPAVTRTWLGSERDTPTTSARRHQAVTSLIAAQASAREPRGLRCMPRSVRMRARTGKAVTDIATPRKRAKTGRGAPGAAHRRWSRSASAAPRRKGARMLVSEIATEAFVRWRMSPVSRCSPTRNM